MVEHHHRGSNQRPQCQPQHQSRLDEAIQQLTLNNSQHGSQILAPRSVIEALPTVRIGERDAKSGLNCAVCLEDFKEHTRARKMPCNHMFHSDCIVPWLLQHNSCPVCRLRLPTESPGSVIKRAFFPFFWPFGGSSQHNHETGGSSLT
ncbi:unnamed protein product [Fraxinus pennsylvanica]|uniref:RING-type E3 ubiquitin transferase n=1 Tax=Fraxinus pennsylvanica TaxID=56036 RepID=A0AAD2A9Z1_9LAMI|nr:unnamed protein product [Fraxinus pennsylvanica]